MQQGPPSAGQPPSRSPSLPRARLTRPQPRPAGGRHGPARTLCAAHPGAMSFGPIPDDLCRWEFTSGWPDRATSGLVAGHRALVRNLVPAPGVWQRPRPHTGISGKRKRGGNGAHRGRLPESSAPDGCRRPRGHQLQGTSRSPRQRAHEIAASIGGAARATSGGWGKAAGHGPAGGWLPGRHGSAAQHLAGPAGPPGGGAG
jgi:hypothetical protein